MYCFKFQVKFKGTCTHYIWTIKTDIGYFYNDVKQLKSKTTCALIVYPTKCVKTLFRYEHAKMWKQCLTQNEMDRSDITLKISFVIIVYHHNFVARDIKIFYRKP